MGEYEVWYRAPDSDGGEYLFLLCDTLGEAEHAVKQLKLCFGVEAWVEG